MATVPTAFHLVCVLYTFFENLPEKAKGTTDVFEIFKTQMETVEKETSSDTTTSLQQYNATIATLLYEAIVMIMKIYEFEIPPTDIRVLMDHVYLLESFPLNGANFVIIKQLGDNKTNNNNLTKDNDDFVNIVDTDGTLMIDTNFIRVVGNIYRDDNLITYITAVAKTMGGILGEEDSNLQNFLYKYKYIYLRLLNKFVGISVGQSCDRSHGQSQQSRQSRQRAATQMIRTRGYDSILSGSNLTANVGNGVSMTRTKLRRISIRRNKPTEHKGGPLYRPTNHGDFMGIATLRKL